jgi:hypothetical protein
MIGFTACVSHSRGAAAPADSPVLTRPLRVRAPCNTHVSGGCGQVTVTWVREGIESCEHALLAQAWSLLAAMEAPPPQMSHPSMAWQHHVLETLLRDSNFTYRPRTGTAGKPVDLPSSIATSVLRTRLLVLRDVGPVLLCARRARAGQGYPSPTLAVDGGNLRPPFCRMRSMCDASASVTAWHLLRRHVSPSDYTSSSHLHSPTPTAPQ